MKNNTYKYNEMNKTSLTTNGWNEWQKYVLTSLDDLSKSYEKLDAKVECNKDTYIDAVNKLQLEMTKQFGEFKQEIGILKTKTTQRATAISVLVGGIPAISSLIYFLLSLTKA